MNHDPTTDLSEACTIARRAMRHALLEIEPASRGEALLALVCKAITLSEHEAKRRAHKAP